MPRRTTRLRRTAFAVKRRDAGFTRAQRAVLATRDEHRCQGCGRNLAELRRIGLRLEAHHRLPKSRGGTNDLANGVMLCGLGSYAGCHRKVDHDREWGYARGLVLHTGLALPALVLVVDFHGVHWHLLSDATRRPG